MSDREAPRRLTFIGVLEKRGRFLTARPYFDRGRSVTVDKKAKGKPGELVELKLIGRGHALIKRHLGTPDVARNVIEALMIERGLQRRFDRNVEREAKEHRPIDAPRQDLRELTTFTIDPETARDYDDAISAVTTESGLIRIYVHIADVTAYVRPGSKLDREAYKRATSVYVPGAVEPMLPQWLSNGMCSLVEGEERLAVTAEFELDGAEVVRCAFYRSTIRSDVRLTYEQVDRVFSGKEIALEPWGDPLALARRAAAALAQKRASRGALTVESEEPKFKFDRDGNVTASEVERQTESHRVIEYLMVTANEQVAKFLEAKGSPTLYRVHGDPDPPRIENLVEKLDSLGVATPPLPEHFTSREAAEIAGDISRKIDAHVRATGHGRRALTSLLLRAQQQASYERDNKGHAGLRLAHYCHFTSPIRRYPDIVCHRALLAELGAGEERNDPSQLPEAAPWTSARERDAMKIERTADDIASCFLLTKQLFEDGFDRVFDGEIVGLIGGGAFVVFGNGFDGLLRVKSFSREWWELNEQETVLAGPNSTEVLRLGDPVRVHVDRIDIPRGRIDLRPEENNTFA